MKKYLFLAVMATTMVACGNSELENVWSEYEEVSAAKDEKKVDPNFLIHNDHYQKGKGETK
jgi:hypothetical protein